jgi:hypothetical protein
MGTLFKRFFPAPALLILLFVILLCAPIPVEAQASQADDVSVCDLAKHPKSFDGKIIRVRGTLNANFEDSSLATTDCDTQQGIWLAFGGDVPSVVASTVNDDFRTPDIDLKVAGVSYGIKKDESFRRLYALLAIRRPGDKPAYRVTATLTGVFLAGQELSHSNGTGYVGGYGHLGCCALFIITQVSDVDSFPPADLNVRGTVLLPDGKPAHGFVVINEVAEGSPPVHQQTTTDAAGHFEFSDSGQLLRFEDPKYCPLEIKAILGGPPVRVKLEDANRTDWIVRSCEGKGDSSSRIGFSARFVLPPKMEAGPFDDEEDGWRSYFIFHRGSDMNHADLIISTAKEELFEEAGRFARSKHSEERWIKDGSGTIIGRDARGLIGRRSYWRRAIFLEHDVADYNLNFEKRYELLDEIVDSVCIAEP